MKIVAIYENTDKKEAIQYASKAAEYLVNQGVDCIVRPSLSPYLPAHIKNFVKTSQVCDFDRMADMVISFGGDGTLLTAAREMLMCDVPIMGFNVGKLGFLAEYSVENLEHNIAGVLNGNFRLVDRAVIETTFEGKSHFALNDFVIEKRNSSKMVTVQVFSNEHCVGDYRADGIVLTTPTGSTAYSLSCSGPIIAPSAKVLCITPISPHTLTIRPLVIPDTNEITFAIMDSGDGVILVADGITLGELKNGENIKFNLSEERVKLIKPQDSSYYDILRTKLLWAANSFDNKSKEQTL
ncbi:MAG: NAD(+)/NADH kinase [Candidatus Kapabacteria bacterium]|nr:NAD(+)/NADH kinase [Ignavibacteriota bacterium]MCW5886273.1 NAD(+)/NADH kinase [Candidatus Kapabacteria bacterium]